MPMEKRVKVTCWGSRGSCPAPCANRLEYGGNTTCFVVETEHVILVLDGGTGLAFFGDQLVRTGDQAGKKQIHIFLSHLHLDHISGIPFFMPLYQKGYRICIYGEERQGKSIAAQLKTIFSPPYWPVGLGQCAAQVTYSNINQGQTIPLSHQLSLHTLRANHPDHTLLYRISAGDKSLVYALDCELDEKMLGLMENFAADTDLLITDAQYSPEEYVFHKGWGHSTWKEGAELARRCHAGQVWFSHFAWGDDDAELNRLEKEARAACPAGCYVREGMSLYL